MTNNYLVFQQRHTTDDGRIVFGQRVDSPMFFDDTSPYDRALVQAEVLRRPELRTSLYQKVPAIETHVIGQTD